MRKLLLGIVAAGSIGAAVPVVAGSFTGTGQFVGLVSPQITALLSQYPGGGPDLRAAIARAVEANPTLADDTVFAPASATQQDAKGAGLADAVKFFANCGLATCRTAESQIRTAISFGDSGTRAGFVVAANPALAQSLVDHSRGSDHCGDHVVSKNKNCYQETHHPGGQF
jgi:hypothetical protein